MAQGDTHRRPTDIEAPREACLDAADSPHAVPPDDQPSAPLPAQPPALPKRTDSPPLGQPPQPTRDVVGWRWFGEATRQMPSWLASMIVHMGLLILLAWYTLPPAVADRMINHLVVSSADAGLDPLERLEEQPLEPIDLRPVPDEVLTVDEAVRAPTSDIASMEKAVSTSPSVDLGDFGFSTAPRSDPMAVVGGLGGGALSGRGDQARKQLVQRYDGTPQSEAAVEAALAWLANHQFADGGWSFAQQLAPRCQGRCRDPGIFSSARNAATGLALLPFLGAGQTHKTGKYQRVVRAGLYFLTSRQDP
ncbi:MAG: hypothetical protein JW719_13310, partial [Pirellulales bacterium]|nr:hypothetical protein [Pirellulales bacterium]